MKVYKLKAIFWKLLFNASVVLNRPNFSWGWKYAVYKNADELISAFTRDLANIGE